MQKIKGWYCAVLYIFVASFLFGEVKTYPYKTGVRKLTPEEKAELEPRIFRITKPRGLIKAPLPSQVKNTTYLPVVTSQGSLGSCAAYATCYYYKTYQEAREHNWVHPNPSVDPEHIASPAWGYNIALRIPFPDGPVCPWQVADYICEYGIASWREMPYSSDMDLSVWPTEEIWKRGIEWRGKQVGAIDISTKQGIEALKEHLANGDLAVVAIPDPPNLFSYPSGKYINNDVFYANSGDWDLGHALTVIGYDDNKEYYDEIEGVNKKGAFLLVNSWGTGWGVEEPTIGTKGFIWIAYDYFLKYNVPEFKDALIMIDRINYRPNLFAIIGINHTKGRKLIVRIKNGEKESDFGIDNVKWEKSALPFSNDYPLTGERIVVDLSDYANYDNFVYYLEVLNLKQFGGEGEITYFAVQRGDNLPLESSDAPKTTIQDWYIWLKAGLFEDAGLLNNLKIRRGGIVWADFNNDGKIDFIITGYNWINGSAVPVTLLFINQGNGRFNSGITAGLPQLGNSFLIAGDYNNDGFPDLILHGYDPSTQKNLTSIYKNNGNNTFTKINIELPDEIIDFSWADYDNDGKLDFAISTDTRILLYHNDGGDVFSLISHFLNSSGVMAWADYDNDGWVDVALCGEEKSVIFRNLGDGIFAEINANLPPLSQGSIAWGDFNSDGYVDLAIAGRVPHNNEGKTFVFRNNGDNTFTNLNLPLLGLWAGSVFWVDVNNDGYIDLLITGRNYDIYNANQYNIYSNHTKIYLNDRNGSFFDGIGDLVGVSCSADISFNEKFTNTIVPVDFDSDGDIDLFLSGTKTYIFPTNPEMIYTGIQKSLVADENGLSRPNSKPVAPSNLSFQLGLENGSVILSWSPGSDSETPQNGLYYNVRVGTYPGGNNIISGVNASIFPFGIPRSARKRILKGLSPGTYYWAVQTIDGGNAFSPWSSESSFTISQYTKTYNLHIYSSDLSQGTTNPSPGIYEYQEGTQVQITAIPNGGYVFSYWSGDVGNPNQNPTTITMNRTRFITGNFSLKYNLSPSWTQLTSSAGWSQRTGHASVVFNNKIWVFGGSSPTGNKNDVWYSADGINWVQVISEAPWSRRFGHISLVFNNKIWILGGYSTRYLNDVWYSSDGINWTQANSNAPWSGRYNATGLVYNGKIWIIGGKGLSGWFNDVWYSTDGINWTQATSSTNWTPREGAAGVVFDGKMWIIGGKPSPAQAPSSDVWYSTDGINWVKATSSANWKPRYLHTALVFDNRIWILGGLVRETDGSWIKPSNEVWYSWDGINWSLVSDLPPWSERYGHSSVVFNNRLFVIGGSTDNGTINDVWSGLPPSLPNNVLILTMATNPSEGGTTTPSPGCHYDNSGAIFSISATPNPGYRFLNWSGDVTNPNSPSTTTILNTNKTITANFERITTHTLTISISPSGSGRTIPEVGNYTFPEGTVVNLMAIPSYRYVFNNWTGDVEEPNSSITSITMDSDKNIVANFIPDPFSPPIRIDGGENHTVFLQNEGTVWTWGCNNYGQLGNVSLILLNSQSMQ